MFRRQSLYVFSLLGSIGLLQGQDVPDKDLQQESDAYMRDELGVNDITAPSIAQILKDLSLFQPVPMDIIAQNPRDEIFDNRLQTSLHFGALVADGFMMTIAQRASEVQDIGRALIRQSQSLSIGDRITKRGKSLLDLSDKGDWQGMREELIRTQADVEKAMLDLRDEHMAHMISLGGWLRGFQIAANQCAKTYNPDRAKVLGRFDIMDYYVDRLNSLHPRLKKTEFVSTLITKLQALRELAASTTGRSPSEAEVKEMRDLANQMEAITVGPVDDDGRISTKPASKNP
jgi:hypothetical protein